LSYLLELIEDPSSTDLWISEH